MAENEQDRGDMTVREAGQKGGEIGGKRTRDKYGPEFYQEIGEKGGERVRELIDKGKEEEES